MNDDLRSLEHILEERMRLRRLSTYFGGASERSPSWSPNDMLAWDQTIEDLNRADRMLREIARRLREQAPDAFASWVADRRMLHEARLASADLPNWERTYLRDTIERWNRFLREDYDDFTRRTSW